MNMSAEEVTVDFNTDPSPPHKGNNSLRVKLIGADGKPVAAAQVNVTFYMAAMPAMGMAAIKKTATLTAQGDGSYAGSLDLPSGGSYQVTITAQRNGQRISSKQLTVNATGGM
jgi:hypothetical protein